MASRYGLEIRAASASDAPALAPLLAEAGSDVAAASLAETLAASREGDGAILLALEWGPPSGIIALHWYRPLTGGRAALVSLLLVAGDARRRGIGRLLLKAGSQAARTAGCDALQLFAGREDRGLEAFCRETGFDPAGAMWKRPLRKRS